MTYPIDDLCLSVRHSEFHNRFIPSPIFSPSHLPTFYHLSSVLITQSYASFPLPHSMPFVLCPLLHALGPFIPQSAIRNPQSKASVFCPLSYGITPYALSFLCSVLRVIPRRRAASLLFPPAASRVFNMVVFSTSSSGVTPSIMIWALTLSVTESF